jgi:hypothetical protein
VTALAALGAKAIIGVNLKEGPNVDSKIASTEVADFNRYIGAKLIDAFELGNEPESYPLSVVNGRRVRGPDTIAAYGTKFSNVASVLGGVPLAGPGSVGPVWRSELGTILSHVPSRLKLVTVHDYPLMNCSRLENLSMSDFFTPVSIQGVAASIPEEVAAAAAHGKPLRGRDQRHHLRRQGRAFELLRRGAVGAEPAAGAVAGRSPGCQLPGDLRRLQPDDPLRSQGVRLDQHVTLVRPNAKGVYAVRVPAHAAAVLKLSS